MYHFLRKDLFREHQAIEIVGHTDLTAQFNWVSGAAFDRPFPGDTLLLDPAYGPHFTDFFDTSVPVMSRAMADALRAFGMSNLDVYPVVLRNPVSGDTRDDYVAVNLVGCADAVDAAQSPHRLRFGKPYFTGAITIDPARTGGMSAFRLLHGPSFIVVDDTLAQRIVAAQFKCVLVQATTAYEGV